MKKPNVVLIVTDDQGYGDIKANENPWLNTPNLDMLCNQGISLESFHTDPLCAPTRASIMSGKYSFGVGVYSTLNARYYMKPDVKTIADSFKDGGYATGLFGKWHLGDTYPYHPHNRGFDVAVSFGGGVIGETPDYWDNDYFDDTYTINGMPRKFDGYCTDNWFSCATHFIDEQIEADKPFFCYIPTNAPHGPLNIDPSYYEKYLEMGLSEDRARYFGMIENIDENIGGLIKHVKAKGEYENTVFIYFGDNGATGGCNTDKNGHLIDGYNAGMRGKKGTTYEGAHRNACFILAPSGVLGEPRKVTGITAQMDIFPTCMELCGLDCPSDLDGISMAKALMEGETHVNEGRTLVVHNMQRDMPQKYKDYTVLRDNMRLVRPLTLESNPFVVGSFGSSVTLAPEMYNIEKDLAEVCDVYADNVELANELTMYYEDWYDDRVDEAIKFSPVYITKDEPTKITCHAWHECTKMCFSQNNVRAGVDGNGYWALKVVDAGTYNIELRRYPRESNLALHDTCDAHEKNARTDFKPAGKAYDIVKASISVAGQKLQREVNKGEESVIFTVDLTEGEYSLRSRFILSDGTSIGAYYVYIETKV